MGLLDRGRLVPVLTGFRAFRFRPSGDTAQQGKSAEGYDRRHEAWKHVFRVAFCSPRKNLFSGCFLFRSSLVHPANAHGP